MQPTKRRATKRGYDDNKIYEALKLRVKIAYQLRYCTANVFRL